MAVDGTYNVEVDTPLGKQTAKLTLKADGDTLSGNVDSSMGGVIEFSGGSVSGDDVAWNMEIDSPLGKIDLEYKGRITGDEIEGEVKAGNFGSSPFKGTRE
jgi:hypothetical protein